MPPQSRGAPRPAGFAQSKSSPNLTTIGGLAHRDRNRPEDITYRPSSPYLNPTANGDLSSSNEDDDDDDEDEDDISTDDDHEGVDDDADASHHGGHHHSNNNSIEGFPALDTDSERPHLYTTRSHPHLPPSSSQLFFPPFYNRPPTPLPPSPSLTSLLRPSFSTHTSHHTTPDSSDTESGAAHYVSALGSKSTLGGGGGVSGVSAGNRRAASASASASAAATTRATSTVPSAHPKVPTYEYYGFALYLASSLFFLMYTLWAYLPSPFLHQLGIYYYPNRWWALAIPCWLVVLVCWIYAALASYNSGRLTLGMGSIECVVDEAGKVAVVDGDGKIIRERGKSRFARGGGGGQHGTAGRGGRKGGGGQGTRKQRSRQGSLEEKKQERERERRVYVPAELKSDVSWRELWNEGTDAVMDVPLGGVCEILYGEGRVLIEDDDENDA